MRLKHWFFILVGILFIWLLYIERSILPPFILAAIFAYIFNPLIGILTKKLRVPRTISILFVYAVLFAVIIFTGAILIRKMSQESIDIFRVINSMIDTARSQTYQLPDWIRPAANDYLLTLKKSSFVSLFRYFSLIPVFNEAISKIVSFFVFLFSGFYFLKDGEHLLRRVVQSVPKKYRPDVELLLNKINSVLGGYLRGQVLLIFLMSLMLYICLAIVGVKFALTIAIFSGIAEIVPYIGPVIAASVAVFVVLLTGSANFGLLPLQAVCIVILIYFVLRHLEDYFIIPHVMGKITKLPPVVIFFAVIAGGHLAGVLGLIIAVPIAAIIRIFLEFSMDTLVLEEKVS